MGEAESTAESSMEEAPKKIEQDFISILTNGIFTFIIGHEPKRFDVHISALKQISSPLGFMMTNGQMKESLDKEAALEDVDTTTFGMLVEFAYKGLCGISYATSGPEHKIFVPFEYHCHYCGNPAFPLSEEGSPYPFCSPSCQDEFMYQYNQSHRYFYCVADGSNLRYSWYGRGLLCNSCVHASKGDHYPKYRFPDEPLKAQDSSPASRCSAAFANRKYGSNDMTHETIADNIRKHPPDSSIAKRANISLLQRAKLYALATQYMVTDLPEICLHILHAQLLIFEINEDTIAELIELVIYVYENTCAEGSVIDGTRDKLRDLVIRYVADRAEDILQYENARTEMMLGAEGAPAVDFLALMYAKTGCCRTSSRA